MHGTSSKAWRMGAKVTAVAVAALAVWIAWRMMLPWWGGEVQPGDLGVALVATALGLLISAGLMALAWRLWARWDSVTVRWAVGTVIAIALLFLVGQANALLKDRVREDVAVALMAVLILLLLLVAAAVYRLLTRFIVRRARLLESLDETGQPSGRPERLRLFAMLMGLSAFYAALRVLELIDTRVGETRGTDAWTDVTLFVPPGIGLLTYKLLVWWMIPRTSPPQPTGGFDVVMPTGRADQK